MASFIVLLGSMIAAALTLAISVHQSDAITLGVATLYMTPVAAISLWRLSPSHHSQPRRRSRHAHPRTPLLRYVLVGICFGLTATAVAIGTVKLADNARHQYRLRVDSDRHVFEAGVDALEVDGKWTEAATLLKQRTTRSISPTWRRALLSRAYADLLEAAARADDPTTSILESCRRLSEEFKLRRSVHAQLSNLARQLTNVKAAVAKAEQRQNDTGTFEAQIAALEAAKKWREAAAMLNDRAAASQTPASGRAAASRAYADLLEAAAGPSGTANLDSIVTDCERIVAEHNLARTTHTHLSKLAATVAELNSALADSRRHSAEDVQLTARAALDELLTAACSKSIALEARLLLYQRAREFARRHGFDVSDIDTEMAKLAALAKANSPRDLSAGLTANIAASWIDQTLPVAVLRVTLRDAGGKPVTDLSVKDFVVTSNDTHISIVASELRQPPSAPLQLTLLIDTSTSTAGTALEQAKRGIEQVATSLAHSTVIKTWSFADTVTPRHNWTQDPQVVAESVAPLVSDGSTALFLAIDQAVEELKSRPAPRAVLVFTDGDDRLGTPTEAELIAHIQKTRVPVFAVALVTSELNEAALTRITQSTGGMLLPVAKPEHLSDALLRAGKTIASPAYRLIVPLPDRSASKLSVRIGNANQIRVTVPLPPVSES